jgi:hypothetical protein
MHHVMRAGMVAGWVLSATLMVVATILCSLELCAWSVLVGIGATMPTAWLMVDHLVRAERDRTELLVATVLRRAREGGGGDDGPDNLHRLNRR